MSDLPSRVMTRKRPPAEKSTDASIVWYRERPLFEPSRWTSSLVHVATVALHKMQIWGWAMIAEAKHLISISTRLFSSGSAPFVSSRCCSLFEEARRRERAFRTSPQQTGLKIMTLWLCLSFAALCLPLRNSSLNTHSAEALARLWAVCVHPQSFS